MKKKTVQKTNATSRHGTMNRRTFFKILMQKTSFRVDYETILTFLPKNKLLFFFFYNVSIPYFK